MKTRYFALVMGIVFLAIGILGFVPALVTPVLMDSPALTVDAGHGLLLGLFPVNVLHNIVHLFFGIWGVVVWKNFLGSRVFSRSTAVVYAIFAVMGFIPILQTTFGLVPLYGGDIWLHALIAIVAAYFGFAPVTTVETGGAARRP